MESIVRTLFTSTVKQFDRKNRTVTFIGTQESPDRTGDIVRVSGIELLNFQKNPVLLWNHNTGLPAIGRILSINQEGINLLFKAEFASFDVNEFADTIFKSVVGGFLSAVSIGFIPKDIEPIFSPDGMIMGLDIIRSELLELSIVNVPAHQNALAASLDIKYQKQLTEMDTNAIQLEEYRKTYEEEYDMKKLEELEAIVTSLKEDVASMVTTIDEQAETIKSLISLRETVDLSKQVMDTLNKSIVSLMSEKKLAPVTPGSEGDGSTPKLPSVDPSELMKTLDVVLSRFNEKAFKTTQVAKGEQ